MYSDVGFCFQSKNVKRCTTLQSIYPSNSIFKMGQVHKEHRCMSLHIEESWNWRQQHERLFYFVASPLLKCGSIMRATRVYNNVSLGNGCSFCCCCCWCQFFVARISRMFYGNQDILDFKISTLILDCVNRFVIRS